MAAVVDFAAYRRYRLRLYHLPPPLPWWRRALRWLAWR